MKQLLSKRWIVLLLVLMVLFASAACQASGSAPMITQAPEIVISETAAPATVPESVPVEADVAFGSGLFNFPDPDRKSTRLNSSHGYISYAVFCLKKKINK